MISMQNEFPSAKLNKVQLDTIEIKDQISIIASTDILIGMHGAAFGYSSFLPTGSGAVEMFPYGSTNWHMEFFIKSADVYYQKWTNSDKSKEDREKGYTTVLIYILKQLINKLC